MPDAPEQHMNVARPPLLWYRVAAWVIVIFSCWGIYELSTSSPGEFTSAGERAVLTASILAMACCSFLVIAVSHGISYLWDDERITTSFLGWTRSMRWDEVDSIVARLAGGSLIYDLCDIAGRRLRVHMDLLRRTSPLHEVLRERWALLVREDMRDIETATEAQFPVRFLGLPTGRFIARGDRLIHQRGPKTREVLLTDIQEICFRYKTDDSEKLVSECSSELLSRTGVRIWIPARTQRYDRLIAYITAHAKNAVQVDLDGPEPPTPAEKAAYLRGKIESFRRERRVEPRGLAFFILFLGLELAIWIGKDWSWVAFNAVFIVGSLGLLIWWIAGGAARNLRQLQGRLDALEAEKGSGEDTELKG